MLYPSSLESKLGFDQIRELLFNQCQGPAGQFYVNKMRMSTKAELINKWLRQADEMMRMLQAGDSLPEQYFIDGQELLRPLEVEGVMIDEEKLFTISRALESCNGIFKTLFAKEKISFPEMHELCEMYVIPTQVHSRLTATFGDDGQVKDIASPELNRIRKELIDLKNKLRRQLENTIRQWTDKEMMPSDMSLTVRNGRLVIPLRAEFKRQVQGFIHDETSNGNIVFIEPSHAFENNNLLRELEFAEQREVQRILSELVFFLQTHLEDIKKAFLMLGLVDFIRAKARFALKIEATIPTFLSTQELRLLKARHPLLWLSHQKSKKPVIPLDITLHEDQRILVISGPNAGGKSICLKTVGLLQVMVQSGLPIPVAEGSQIGLFQNLMVNIGDEQSIENDLSTYSSHLAAMKVFLAQANDETLFLIDEFGSGTEPQMGGAIAEAILEMLNNKKAFGVVTTHYTNLKKQADKTQGMVNGAMKYDIANMEPLFELEIGQPGSSFALEIAEKSGLPRSVVNLAKNKAGVKHVQLEEMLRNLELEKKNTAEKLKELREREQWVNKLTADLESQKQKLAQTKDKLMTDARQEAKKLLDEANAKIELTIRAIKESQADKNVTRKLREELTHFKQEVEKQLEPTKEVIAQVSGELQVGDYVQIAETESFGQVTELKDKEATVNMGNIRSTVKKNRLIKISAKDFKNITEGKGQRKGNTLNISEKMMNFQMSIDLRGKRANEALSELDQWLDQALLVGADRLRILHGKGDGILRKIVRNHLKGYKQVQEAVDENPDRGGDGVTLVKLV